MDFKCYKCKQKFAFLKDVCDHLRYIHFLSDHFEEMGCIANKNISCTKTFATFKGLRNHAMTCIKSNQPIEKPKVRVDMFFLGDKSYVK